jgi:hypothetical protein
MCVVMGGMPGRGQAECDLDPWLVMQVSHVELLARCMWQHLVVLLENLVESLQTTYLSVIECPLVLQQTQVGDPSPYDSF